LSYSGSAPRAVSTGVRRTCEKGLPFQALWYLQNSIQTYGSLIYLIKNIRLIKLGKLMNRYEKSSLWSRPNSSFPAIKLF
jgi:hypothetical protein